MTADLPVFRLRIFTKNPNTVILVSVAYGRTLATHTAHVLEAEARGKLLWGSPKVAYFVPFARQCRGLVSRTPKHGILYCFWLHADVLINALYDGQRNAGLGRAPVHSPGAGWGQQARHKLLRVTHHGTRVGNHL